jgi:chemotaxis protein CheY-P-specific phosphatase CheC
MELSIIENDLAKEIVNIALAKAGDALSFFIKQRTIIKNNSVSVDPISKDSCFTTITSDFITSLKTEIKGDFDGNCYLLFSEEDTNKILELTLPSSILNDKQKKTEFGNAILLEIDNIVTASVVTQFSNIFSCKMFGYVPNINRITKTEINEFLFNENQNKNLILNIKTKFITDKDKLEPEFVWFMNQEKFKYYLNIFKNNTEKK